MSSTQEATAPVEGANSRSTLQYKGYNGSVQYSAEDRTLHGTVLGIRDSISFDGADVNTLEKNFMSAVDEYLAFCAEEGKTPDVPYKGTFNVRLSRDLHKRAALFAADNDKKLNNVVSDALEQYLTHA